MVKNPQHDKTQREIEYEEARKCVAKGTVMRERYEVLKIGCKTAHNQGRHYKACPAERQCSGRVGEGEGH